MGALKFLFIPILFSCWVFSPGTNADWGVFTKPKITTPEAKILRAELTIKLHDYLSLVAENIGYRYIDSKQCKSTSVTLSNEKDIFSHISHIADKSGVSVIVDHDRKLMSLSCRK